MLPASDPIALLERLSARAGAGRAVSAELADEVLEWITRAAPAILAGEPPAKALNLSGRRGCWQRAPLHRARFYKRDGHLRELWPLTDGCDAARARQVYDWIAARDTFNNNTLTGSQARRVAASIPPAAWQHLDGIADTGLPVPAQQRLIRVMRPASHDVLDSGDYVSIDLEAPPVAATSNGT